MHPNSMQCTKTWVRGPMGLIGCVRCEKSRRDFVARTFALTAPVHPVCIEFDVVTNRSQMHPNTMQRTKTWVYGPMGWIGCIRCDKSRCDFVARTFALVAPIHPVLHWVSCSYKMITNAPKHYYNAPKLEFRVQCSGLDAFVAKHPGVTSWHELLY